MVYPLQVPSPLKYIKYLLTIHLPTSGPVLPNILLKHMNGLGNVYKPVSHREHFDYGYIMK